MTPVALLQGDTQEIPAPRIKSGAGLDRDDMLERGREDKKLEGKDKAHSQQADAHKAKTTADDSLNIAVVV